MLSSEVNTRLDTHQTSEKSSKMSSIVTRILNDNQSHDELQKSVETYFGVLNISKDSVERMLKAWPAASIIWAGIYTLLKVRGDLSIVPRNPRSWELVCG